MILVSVMFEKENLMMKRDLLQMKSVIHQAGLPYPVISHIVLESVVVIRYK